MQRYGKFLSPTLVKFVLTGLSGVFVNLGSFQLLLSLRVHELLASPIAIELSIISNFLLNNYWTFSDRTLSGKRRVRGVEISPRFACDAYAELWHVRVAFLPFSRGTTRDLAGLRDCPGRFV